jgi:hypothetical protein
MAEKTRQKLSSRRLTWHTAIAPSFPNEKQLGFMKKHFRIQSLHFCSVPDADGKLEDVPRKISGGGWGQNKVQIMFRRGTSGAREEQWALFFQHMNFEPVAEVIQRTRTVPLNEHFARIYKDDVRSTELSKNIIKFYEEKKKDAGKGSSSDESESDSAADTPVKKNGTPRKYTTKKMFKNPRTEGVLEAAIAAGGLPPFESFDWKNLECKIEAGSAGKHFAAPEISGEFSADEGAAPLFPGEFSADAGAAPLFPGEFSADAGAAPEITAGAWAAGGNFAGDGGYGGAGDGGYGGAPAWDTGSYATPSKEPPPKRGVFDSPQPQAAQPRRNPSRTPAFLQKLQNNPAFQQLVHSTPPFPGNRAARPKVTPPAKCCLFGSGDSSPEPEEGDEGAGPAVSGINKGDEGVGPAMSGASEGAEAAGTVVSDVSEKDADPLPPAARHARRGLFVEPTPSPKAAGDESSKENEEPIEAGNKKRPRESEPEEAPSGRQKKKASPPPRPPPRKVSPPASMRGGAGRAQLLATAPSQAKTRAQQQATAQSHAKSRSQPQPAAKGHAKSRSQPQQQPAQGQGPAKIVVRRVGPRPGAASGGVVVSKVYAPSPSPEKELPPPPPLYEALLREFLALPNVYVRGKGGCTRDLNILGVIRALLTREVYQGVEHRAFFDTKNRAGLGLLYPGKEEEGGNPNLGPSTLELHRRALRLEWVGENILSVLGEAVKNVGVSKVGCLVTKADRDDLEAAFRFHGGVPGQGVDYWLATPDGNLPR